METSKQANNHGIMVRLGNTNHLFLRGQHRVRDVGGVDASDTSGAHAPCSTVIHVQTTHLYRPPITASVHFLATPHLATTLSSCTGPAAQVPELLQLLPWNQFILSRIHRLATSPNEKTPVQTNEGKLGFVRGCWGGLSQDLRASLFSTHDLGVHFEMPC